MMQPHRHPLPHRLGLGLENAQPGIDAAGGRVQRRIEHDVAALDRLLGDAGAGQRQGAPLAHAALLRSTVLHMQRAHARFQAGWADHDCVADGDAP
jgi:hypothetical protein